MTRVEDIEVTRDEGDPLTGAKSFADFSDDFFDMARFRQLEHYDLAVSTLTRQTVAMAESKLPIGRRAMRHMCRSGSERG